MEILALDPAGLAAWAKQHGVGTANPATVRAEPRLHAAIRAGIEAINTHFASFGTIKYFCFVPREFAVEDGQLTPGLKIDRRVIEKRYAADTHTMYDAATRS